MIYNTALIVHELSMPERSSLTGCVTTQLNHQWQVAAAGDRDCHGGVVWYGRVGAHDCHASFVEEEECTMLGT